nr:MAG: hypothetical protein 2 [Leviviridae sp.]
MALNLKNAADAAVVYTRYRFEGNKAVYIGPAHSDLIKDQISLGSTSPKQTKETYGTRRSTINVIRSIEVGAPNVADNVVRDMKLEALASVPNGATFSEFSEHVARLVAALSDPSVCEELFLVGKIDH